MAILKGNRAGITAERFAQGYTWSEYMQVIQQNKERFAESYAETQVSPEDCAFFAQVPGRVGGKLRVVALAEDWCPDVYTNLPILIKIAECSPDIEVRIFPRDKNLDIMDAYLNQGQFRSIPTFVFLDNDFNELGVWIERPRAANELRERLMQELAQQPGLSEEEARAERSRRLREAYRTGLRQETIREIRQVLEAALAARSD